MEEAWLLEDILELWGRYCTPISHGNLGDRSVAWSPTTNVVSIGGPTHRARWGGRPTCPRATPQPYLITLVTKSYPFVVFIYEK